MAWYGFTVGATSIKVEASDVDAAMAVLDNFGITAERETDNDSD